MVKQLQNINFGNSGGGVSQQPLHQGGVVGGPLSSLRNSSFSEGHQKQSTTNSSTCKIQNNNIGLTGPVTDL